MSLVVWRTRTPERQALVESELRRVTALLAEQGAKAVVLFGSHARGDAWDASDVDLLVVVPWSPSDPPGARAPALLGRLTSRVALDLVVYTPEEFEALRGQAPLLRAALAEGKVLHGRI